MASQTSAGTSPQAPHAFLTPSSTCPSQSLSMPSQTSALASKSSVHVNPPDSVQAKTPSLQKSASLLSQGSPSVRNSSST